MHGIFFRFAALVILISALEALAETPRLLDAKLYHLGTPGAPEWEEFARDIPQSRSVTIKFIAKTNTQENTLFIRQRDVKYDWSVELNGRKLGKLFLMEADLIHTLTVPVGTMRDGENTLAILPPKELDDIVVGEIRLDSRPFQSALSEAMIAVEVTDADNRRALPCRLTIADNAGALAPIFASSEQRVAARPGVVYTADGKARIGVQPGSYTLYATRGFEYGLDSKRVSIRAGQARSVRLQIRREVPTPGLASCDTHIHTFTYSGHGDATLDERMITLAGEGIEVPIATDHNVLTDFSEAAKRVGVQNYFTPVIGDEVTTKAGHFNVFPVKSGSAVPDFQTEDWPKLMKSIRSTPGVQIAILNHPRDLHTNFRPFAETNFNPVTGENKRGPEFSFDALELINSGALQSDLMRVYRDWFALLNHGYRVAGVGASDSHDVSRYIVGQGRTYVACNDTDPSRIDPDQICRSFREGRVLVSMGLLTQMTVNDRFVAGDLATGIGEKMRVTVTVLGPSWTRADRVELFANGEKIREQQIKSARSAEKAKVTWTIPRPRYDVHLVAIATGPGVTGPYWAIPRSYQPTSRVWEPRLIGSTNPIWVDADGDGKFTAARAYAKELWMRIGADPVKLLAELASYDQAVTAQAASFGHAGKLDLRSIEFKRLLATAPEHVQKGVTAFIATLE
ncbi:MAG: hypothetical protein DME26_20935 [Verrucomicrobia bacterium]|nr:MAG: hypothetical protein DME26_20935 [Verrucomicrobiota bacterium]